MLFARAKYFTNRLMQGTTLHTVQYLLHNGLILLSYLRVTHLAIRLNLLSAPATIKLLHLSRQHR